MGEGPEAQLDREKGANLVPHERFADETSSTSSVETQAGVKRVEAVTSSWTKWSLAIAYIGYTSLPLHVYHPRTSPASSIHSSALSACSVMRFC